MIKGALVGPFFVSGGEFAAVPYCDTLPRNQRRSGERKLLLRAGLVVACCANVAAASASAQSTTDPDIVVTGERDPATQREIAEQARNISIVGSPLDNPLPRFEGWICPGVMGLKNEAAGYVVARIRDTAEELNLRLAPDDGTCEPNLIVAFVEDAQNELVELAQSQGYMLAGLSIDQRGELLDTSGAARVWVNTMTRTNTGMPVPSQRDASSAPERTVSYDAGSSSPIRVTLPPVAAGWSSHSRIYFPTREDIVSVLVLFDREQVRGKTLLQLADYATMRSLSLTRETRGEVSAETILGLFDGAGVKTERLTAFDRGYLASLYEGIPNMPAASKLAAVNRHMEDWVPPELQE